jgi:hypothetical protein
MEKISMFNHTPITLTQMKFNQLLAIRKIITINYNDKLYSDKVLNGQSISDNNNNLTNISENLNFNPLINEIEVKISKHLKIKEIGGETN